MSSGDSIPTEKRVLEYIENQLSGGDTFIKSRHIAGKLGISAKQVGAVMRSIEDYGTSIEVNKWGGSSDGITWYIERVEQG
jgi:biotin operon repressor